MPTTPPGGDITRLLGQLRAGSPEAEAALMKLVYPELRKLAASYMRRERAGVTLQPTALVHEAYIRMLPQKSVRWENRAHFFGILASMMRRVLVDHARRRGAIKRDGLASGPVSVSGLAAPRAGADPVDVLDLDTALTALAALDPRQAKVVEKKFFAGMTQEEIAEVMGISLSTVKRELDTAVLWLKHRMKTVSRGTPA